MNTKIEKLNKYAKNLANQLNEPTFLLQAVTDQYGFELNSIAQMICAVENANNALTTRLFLRMYSRQLRRALAQIVLTLGETALNALQRASSLRGRDRVETYKLQYEAARKIAQEIRAQQ